MEIVYNFLWPKPFGSLVELYVYPDLSFHLTYVLVPFFCLIILWAISFLHR
jgi:hypothetical protein